MENRGFDTLYLQLTGNPPFPWQGALYGRFVKGDFPMSIDLPTGLGKTAVIPIWLIALAAAPDCVPRRLAYVVNRRTVVDQTTREVEEIRANLNRPELAKLKDKIGSLAISTLRGQFADNREWSADPSRPAIVIGTVDMIGSRLLFSGYGAGFRTRPLYAGLLGQDTLLVHDEAHLEPAFQQLIERIRDEQKNEPALPGERFHLRVLEMSATPRGTGDTIRLQDADLANTEVKQRIGAKKVIQLTPNNDPKKLADQMAELARGRFEQTARAVLIFARRVEDAEKIAKKLPQDRTRLLTGTLRGLERDQLVEHPVFKRFLPRAEACEQTVYLVCTSAGEVGVNISADHLVCDLSTFDSMAQRLGRVNRFGLRADTEVHIFHPKEFDEKNELDERLRRSLDLLRDLKGDGSPKAISRLKLEDRVAAFAPPPTILYTSDILLDAWTMTSIHDELPGRPKVEPYLHGIQDLELPQTYVAWREEVGQIRGDLLKAYPPQDLLDYYPLKPQELLRDRSDRVLNHLAQLATRRPAEPAWIVDVDGGVVVTTLGQIARDGKEGIQNRTIVLSPDSGGLSGDGMLDGGDDAPVADVSDRGLLDDSARQRRIRVWNDDPDFDLKTSGMRLIRRIDFSPDDDDEDAEGRSWYWFERPAGGDSDGSMSAIDPILWDDHTRDVVANVKRFTNTLPLSADLKNALLIAARFHDFGKKRDHWQRSIGNPNPAPPWYAKSGKDWRPRGLGSYRHEFGSLLDILEQDDFKKLANKPELQELILHLIGAHHGFARPYFPPECTVDSPAHSTAVADAMAREIPRRFGRLQRRYGRWGLAYLEGLLRTADYEASAHPAASEGV
ncbi:MAG: type I-U CRISPR-associated helicase/endonuclease Cas3 [Tepidisphaeraceae bacterium]